VSAFVLFVFSRRIPLQVYLHFLLFPLFSFHFIMSFQRAEVVLLSRKTSLMMQNFRKHSFLFTNSIRLTILPGARVFIDKPFIDFSL
jgi:hypothetical protein